MKALIKIIFNLSKIFLAFNIITKSECITFFFTFLIKSVKSAMI